MARDIDKLERYYENAPFAEDALSSEVHGLKAQEVINQRVKSLVDLHDEAMKMGDQEGASRAKSMIYRTDKEVANAEVWKQEHASMLRSQSLWGDMTIPDKVATEQGEIDFDEQGKIIFYVFDERIDRMVVTSIDEMSQEFHEIGDWMQPLMKMKQELIGSKNDFENPPPFDINFAVNNLIKNNWKSMIADPDPTLDPNGPSKGFRLQLILHSAVDENGNLPEGYNIDKYSFDPTNDTRLFKIISDELKSAFKGVDKQEEQQMQMEQPEQQVEEQPKQQTEGPLSGVNNTIPNIQ